MGVRLDLYTGYSDLYRLEAEDETAWFPGKPEPWQFPYFCLGVFRFCPSVLHLQTSSPFQLTTVVIPYIDEVDLLAEALSSVLDQTASLAEIVLVCNAPNVIRLSTQMPRTEAPLRWIHEPRKGSAYARNAGLAAATGEWVQFLDVDDLLAPEKIERQCREGDADVIVSPHVFRKLSGKKIPSAWTAGDIWAGLLGSGLGSTSSWLFRRAPLLTVGGWAPAWTSHQEYELLFRLLAAGYRVKAVGDRDTIVRQRLEGSITFETASDRPAEGIRLRERIRDYLAGQQGLYPAREEAFRQYVFRQLRGVYRADHAQALAGYNRWIAGKKFRAAPPLPRWYRMLVNHLGFPRVEAWLAAARRLLMPCSAQRLKYD